MSDGPDQPDDGNREPGIVALRPLGLEDVLGGALRFLRRQPVVAFVPAAIVMLILAPVQFGAQASVSAGFATRPPTSFAELFASSLLVSVPLVVLALVIAPPSLAVEYSGLLAALRGRRMSLGGAWSVARPRLARTYAVYLVVSVIGAVVTGIGFGLAFLVGQAGGGTAILVAVLIVLVTYAAIVYVGVLLGFAIPSAVIEGLDVRAALARSLALVRGAWWRIFGFQLVAALLAMVAAMVVVIPASILGAVVGFASADSIATTGTLPASYYVIIGVATVIVGAVLVPFLLAVTGLLYTDRRIRRERWDPVAQS